MTTNRSIKNVVICLAILGLLIWLSALANPLQKPGNPGIPGLLTEISELYSQIEVLETTIQNIKEQNDDLEAKIEDLVSAIQDLENFAPVPKTGKTKYWVSFGHSIDFAGTGQDGI
jgi:hypothetical protein